MMQIQESLRLARLSLNQVPDPILWADCDGRIVDCNAGACLVLGYTTQELIGSTIFTIDPSLSAENWPADFAELRRRRVKHQETWYRTKDDRLIPMDLQVTHLCFGDQELCCVVARDLTQRKLMEEERLRIERQTLTLQKLESLGTLSGGIAHDFNNLLQVVLGNLDLTLMLMHPSEPLRRNLEQAVIATVRASELSGMMLAYTGKGVLAVKELNLSALLEENAPMLSSLIPRNVAFSSALPANLPDIQADATQVLQVVLNLVRNASEAIGDSDGTLTVSAGVQDFDQATLDQSRLDEKLPAGRYVWIEVADTGCGMDQATQDRCFDPFFTTKFTGRGLGMSATLGIIRAHKGGILLKSRVGLGTTVQLLFPLAPGPQAFENPTQAGDFSAEPGRPHDTVLVVDDEEMVRTLSVATLQAFGFETLVACDGAEALEIFRNEGSRISLVLLDQNMPLMDGQEVFRELRRLHPEVKVLLASGYSRKEVSARFKGLNLNGFIQKPYNVKHLLDEIKRVLG
jgi:PAS domain S-box-containing protein